MHKVVSYAEHMLWAIACLAVLLVAMWFILNFVATKAPGPLATAASTVEGLVSGSAYGL